MANQVLVPISDGTNPDSYTNEADGTTLWSSLDETTGAHDSDTTYIKKNAPATSPSYSVCNVNLMGAVAPGDNTGTWTIRIAVRNAGTAPFKDFNAKIELLSGVTVWATLIQDVVPAAYTVYSYVLTTAEKDAMLASTDWRNLFFRVSSNQSGVNPNNARARWTATEFETPGGVIKPTAPALALTGRDTSAVVRGTRTILNPTAPAATLTGRNVAAVVRGTRAIASPIAPALALTARNVAAVTRGTRTVASPTPAAQALTAQAVQIQKGTPTAPSPSSAKDIVLQVEIRTQALSSGIDPTTDLLLKVLPARDVRSIEWDWRADGGCGNAVVELAIPAATLKALVVSDPAGGADLPIFRVPRKLVIRGRLDFIASPAGNLRVLWPYVAFTGLITDLRPKVGTADFAVIEARGLEDFVRRQLHKQSWTTAPNQPVIEVSSIVQDVFAAVCTAANGFLTTPVIQATNAYVQEYEADNRLAGEILDECAEKAGFDWGVTAQGQPYFLRRADDPAAPVPLWRRILYGAEVVDREEAGSFGEIVNHVVVLGQALGGQLAGLLVAVGGALKFNTTVVRASDGQTFYAKGPRRAFIGGPKNEAQDDRFKGGTLRFTSTISKKSKNLGTPYEVLRSFMVTSSDTNLDKRTYYELTTDAASAIADGDGFVVDPSEGSKIVAELRSKTSIARYGEHGATRSVEAATTPSAAFAAAAAILEREAFPRTSLAVTLVPSRTIVEPVSALQLPDGSFVYAAGYPVGALAMDLPGEVQGGQKNLAAFADFFNATLAKATASQKFAGSGFQEASDTGGVGYATGTHPATGKSAGYAEIDFAYNHPFVKVGDIGGWQVTDPTALKWGYHGGNDEQFWSAILELRSGFSFATAAGLVYWFGGADDESDWILCLRQVTATTFKLALRMQAGGSIVDGSTILSPRMPIASGCGCAARPAPPRNGRARPGRRTCGSRPP